MRTIVSLALILAVLAPSQLIAARLIPFQGRLTDATGAPVADGVYSITFSIYDEPLGGTPVIIPEVHSNVSIIGGVVNVLLGAIESLDTVSFVQTRYLGITVGTGQEMVPRHELVPAFHSRTAEVADLATQATVADLAIQATFADLATHAINADFAAEAAVALTSVGEVPIGGIIPFFGNPATIPNNWKICDGSIVNDPESPLNGIALPDLRDRMIQGEENTSKNLLTQGLTEAGQSQNPGNSGSTSLPHSHNLPSLTGRISNSGADPGFGEYKIRNDDGAWNGSNHLDVGGSTSNNEGHHYHNLGGTTVTTGLGSHRHSVAGDNRPPYTELHFLARIK